MDSAHTPSLESPVAGVTLRRVDVGTGVVLRVAEAGPTNGDLVLLVHGWPESWFSWRHQLTALAAAGFRAIAPDLRGFGGSDAPPNVEDYDVHSMAADWLGLLAHYGRQQAHLVGHDFGAIFSWSIARMFPQRFPSLCIMSVPDLYDPHREPTARRLPPLDQFRKLCGQPTDPEQGFMYILYHSECRGRDGPAEAEYDSNPRQLLWKCLTDRSVPKDPPPVTDPRRVAGGFCARLPNPKRLPAWLTQAEFDYFVQQFTRPQGRGFRGGVNMYRNLNRNYFTTKYLQDVFVKQPTLFIAGEDDVVLNMSGGLEKVRAALPQSVPGLRKAVFIPKCGHWIQQEKAQETNEELLAFIRSLPPLAPMSKL